MTCCLSVSWIPTVYRCLISISTLMMMDVEKYFVGWRKSMVRKKWRISLLMVQWLPNLLLKTLPVCRNFLFLSLTVWLNWFLIKYPIRSWICGMPLIMFLNCKQQRLLPILWCAIRWNMPRCWKAMCVVPVCMPVVRLSAVMILLTGYL